MEALTAVSVAALTIYDMAKAVERGMVISDIRLLEKARQQAGCGSGRRRMNEPTRINVGVRASPRLREALGFAETTVSVAAGTDIAGLMARLNELYPRADLAVRRYGVALNRSYARLPAV